MTTLLSLIEANLLWLVLGIAALGLIVPELGLHLAPYTSALLALLMLIISLTFDLRAVGKVFRKPSQQVLALSLVYVPMSIAGLLTGRLFFGTSPLASGQILLGTLPTDVSSPLLVLMARGNVALAAVFNAVNTALSPFIVPFLFLWLTGIRLEVPLSSIISELVIIVLLPTIVGVGLRTRYGDFFARYDRTYAGAGSVVYLVILLAVIGPNAQTIIGYGWFSVVIGAAALTLNLIGYVVGMLSRLTTSNRETVIAYLFTVSKKEFSIAAAFVTASGLPAEVAIPAAFYAFVQMITSPIAAKILVKKT